MTMISPQYFDTTAINVSNPMCMLVSVAVLCDTSSFMSPYNKDFPIQFKFQYGKATQHCRHYPMNQVTCKVGKHCPAEVTCNLKMNGSRKFKDWSWECNSPGGKVHYESCYGYKDMSCVNVGSFHFRHHDTRGPIKLNTVRPNINYEKQSYFKTISNFIVSGIHLFTIAVISMVLVYFFSGIFEVLFECIPYFLAGLLFFSLMGSSDDDDSGWYETSGECDD